MASLSTVNEEQRGAVRRIVDAFDREEKGYSAEQEPPLPRVKELAKAPSNKPVNGTNGVSNGLVDFETADQANGTRRTDTSLTQPRLLPTHSKLRTFRVLTGIDTPAGLATASIVRRPASNVGIYTRVVRSEARYKKEYRFFTMLISCCLGVQIIVAAALTALGAGNGPRILITIFGAVNTAIAGYLTYLKGSGLPNRKRYHQTQYAKIREHIEQRERDFCMEDCDLDVFQEIQKIRHLYEEVQEDVEANTPENYANVRRADKNSPLPYTQDQFEKNGSVTKDEKKSNGVVPPLPIPPPGVKFTT